MLTISPDPTLSKIDHAYINCILYTYRRYAITYIIIVCRREVVVPPPPDLGARMVASGGYTEVVMAAYHCKERGYRYYVFSNTVTLFIHSHIHVITAGNATPCEYCYASSL